MNEIYKMMFHRSFYARFLSGHNFDLKAATQAFSEYLTWRQQLQVDLILDHEFIHFFATKELFPNGFHEVDQEGRPIFIIAMGQIKLNELLSVINQETFVKFLYKELEHTWREKFEKCEQVSNMQVDQIKLIIDMKGATLKQVTNKASNQFFKQVFTELANRFPEFVESVFVLNAPMFFEGFFDTEVRPFLSEKSIKKITITGESSHANLLT